MFNLTNEKFTTDPKKVLVRIRKGTNFRITVLIRLPNLALFREATNFRYTILVRLPNLVRKQITY